ncbi:MAG: pseudaminic acid synthase [Chloroflexi bacterium]|nr:pseudaminic acid synthase [Chloroflexota bacterium]|tara:strand:- start:347 stop:1405 length:1059 start_codon:yes stop_codon:yes gene_type:complete
MKNKRYIEIEGTKIGKEFPPYLIAEMSANHNGNINTAKEIIKSAKESGASAVKLQTYKPETITLDLKNSDFILKGGLWDGRSLFDLYKEAHMPWEWHSDLFDYAKELGITIFSSPFDFSAVDLLEDLNTPAYKIASFEVTDLRLIKYIASTRKPLIISTGMANKEEIQEAIDVANESGCDQIAILHCVSGYPAPSSDYNLATLLDLSKQFNKVVGLSDHTLDNVTAIASIALGSSIVEKHFTLDRELGGPDSDFSLEPRELKILADSLNNAWEAIGNINYDLKSSEESNVKFRRSIYFVKDLKAGEVITEECLRSVRPGYGLPTKYFDSLIGKKIKKDVVYGTPTSFELIED